MMEFFQIVVSGFGILFRNASFRSFLSGFLFDFILFALAAASITLLWYLAFIKRVFG